MNDCQHDTQQETSFDYEDWFASIETIREDIRLSHGGVFPKIDAISILRDIRDGEDDE